MAIKTLDDIIGKNDRYDQNKVTLYRLTLDERLIIQDITLFRTYRRFIDNYIHQYRIPKNQRVFYQYRPDLLSQDIYGTPELAWMILILNDQESPSKFRLKSTIKLIPPEELSDVYDMLMTRSTTKLNRNWNEFLPLAEQSSQEDIDSQE